MKVKAVDDLEIVRCHDRSKTCPTCKGTGDYVVRVTRWVESGVPSNTKLRAREKYKQRPGTRPRQGVVR